MAWILASVTDERSHSKRDMNGPAGDPAAADYRRNGGGAGLSD